MKPPEQPKEHCTPAAFPLSWFFKRRPGGVKRPATRKEKK